MAYEWKGQRYDEEFKPIGDYGVVLGPIDSNAENEYWAAHGGRNQPSYSPPPLPSAAAPATPAQPDELTTNVKKSINDALTAGVGVDENDPTYQAQDAANKVQSQRAADRARMSAVQRAHAQGLGDSGAEDAMIRRLQGAQGEAEQAQNAQLRAGFLEASRQKVAQALQLGAGIMTAQEERDLRARLADIQAALAREQIKYQYDALGTNYSLNLAQLQQQAMQGMFGLT